MRKLRSDITRRGLTRTPQRAFMRAMGLDDAAIARPARRMDLLIDEAELAARRAAWRPQPPRHRAGLLAKYARQVALFS